jgi:hypothetical protein
MGLFVERYYGWGEDGGQFNLYMVYRQPWWRYVVGELVSAITLRTGKLERVVERAFPAKGERDMPFGARVDCWVFEFTNKDRTPVAEWDDAGPDTKVPLPPEG